MHYLYNASITNRNLQFTFSVIVKTAMRQFTLIHCLQFQAVRVNYNKICLARNEMAFNGKVLFSSEEGLMIRVGARPSSIPGRSRFNFNRSAITFASRY